MSYTPDAPSPSDQDNPSLHVERNLQKPQYTPSQARRINATARNMILATLICLACVIPIILLAAGPSNDVYRKTADVQHEANNAEKNLNFKPVAPSVPKDWSANYARVEDTGSKKYWDIGYAENEKKFVKLSQIKDPTKKWIQQNTDSGVQQGVETINKIEWTILIGEKYTSFVGTLPDKTTVVLSTESQGNPPAFDSLRTLAQKV